MTTTPPPAVRHLGMSVGELRNVECRVEVYPDRVDVTRFAPFARFQFSRIDELPAPVRSRLVTLRILDDLPSDGIPDVGMRVSESTYYIDCPYGEAVWQ